jgi:methylated-DNA-[protein]-cysteine S-methyltransferase
MMTTSTAKAAKTVKPVKAVKASSTAKTAKSASAPKTALATRTLATPIGTLTLYAGARGLRGVRLPDERHPLGLDGGTGAPPAAERIVEHAARELGEYFAGRRRDFTVALEPDGTEFQRQVWLALRRIPFAATWSYGQLAAAIGKPSASRAVGAANGRNPLPIIVPCHRVIGQDGSLTGFGGGLPTKRWLLAHESGIVAPPLPL